MSKLVNIVAAMALIGEMGLKDAPRQKYKEPPETKEHKKLRENRAKKRRQKKKSRGK